MKTKTEKSDELLVKEFISGSQQAFTILLNRHKDKIYSYILYMVKDTENAEDLFQDTFFKVINTLKSGTYKEEGKFIQWAMRISHNLVIDFFRKGKRFPTIESNDESDVFDFLDFSEPSIEDTIITEQIHSDIRKLIAKLPPEQKEVLIMRHYSDMSFKEISERTNISINTALGRMRYALINIRKMIEGKEGILLK
jgi:RNA polymerase sigma factor (sigma-70 family)